MATLQHGLVGDCGLTSVVDCCLNDVCIYQRQQCMEREREGEIFPPKWLQRCKTGCGGPWHRLARLTDWKQGFIFSNLWSQPGEGSVKRGRGWGGVLGETLEGEMKDIVQDKLSSADVDERRPANRNKWDGFDLKLTCCFKKPPSVFQYLSSFISSSPTSIFLVHHWGSPHECLTGN